MNILNDPNPERIERFIGTVLNDLRQYSESVIDYTLTEAGIVDTSERTKIKIAVMQQLGGYQPS